MRDVFTAYTPDALKRLTGDAAQLAGIELAELTEGRARGIRVANVHTGSGFRFQALLDRGMDIRAADHNGRSIAWLYPALAAPAYHERDGYGWGRTWGGGLLTTCGLTHFGQPEQDGGETLGLHGRIAHIPAEGVQVSQAWQGDEYVLAITGRMQQVGNGVERLILDRRITTRLGANSLTIDDTLTNDGYRPAPHMILYHCNFGFPVLSPDSELLVDDEEVHPHPLIEAAARGLDGHRRFEPPQDSYPDQVFFHKPRVDAQGFSQAAIVNPALGFGGYVRWRAAELPCMGQWKQLMAGQYVCALEPASYWETPRHQLRAEGRLRFLSPGEIVHYHLELGALPNAAAIAAFEHGDTT